MARAVLIVEDDRDQNEMLAQLVGRRGFSVVQTYTGKEGVDQARSQPPDLLLLDLMLPDIDGFEVCESLRASRETNLIPIVMATALAEPRHRERGYRVGANAYIVKPYTRQQIYDAIDQALAWKEEMIHGRVQREFSFELTSETEYLIEVNNLLSQLLLLTKLDERSAGQLCRALLEMGQNAIEWGNQNQVDALVKITYRLHPDHVSLLIRDEGSGFDTANIPHAAREEDPLSHISIREVLGLREGGFGLLISRGLVDEMRHNEAGNEVTLIKRFPPTRMGAAELSS
jgi:CheY-like chemotaxis protein/anti-sigma regulatory factor (Ser/Thr protein kinase)